MVLRAKSQHKALQSGSVAAISQTSRIGEIAVLEKIGNAVDEAIATRRSVRGFLDTVVSRETIEEILALASRAPSGTNMQPWRVYVATGDTLQRLNEIVQAAFADTAHPRAQEYKYYPDAFPEPYKTRRRKVGWELYGLLGIKKGDGAKMFAQHLRNFQFFDAPVGMIFTIDRALEIGSWLDYGMFLENIMIAARGRGLHTCPQAAFAPYHREIREVLNIPDDQVVICGMAMGYEDESLIENSLRTERVPVEEFARFYE